MSKINYDKYKENNEMNTWVSQFYCKNWGLREGMREILQNQKDEIINQIGKNNFETKPCSGSSYEFDFIHKETQEIYGGIRYDRAMDILTIENKGHLETFNLLLGGTSRNQETKNKDIIGCFGEGLKLAALAFLREDKSFTIYNNDQVWRFYLKEDNYFIRNGKPEKCLFWRSENSKNSENKDKVVIVIENISFEEWEDQIDNFLWLVSKVKKIGLIHTEKYGDIILGEEFRNKIYSKEVFVTKSIDDICYGYNIDLILDRDRNCIPNYKDFQEKGNKIIWYLLENFKEERQKQNQNLDHDEIKLLNEFPKKILQFLEKGLSFLQLDNYYSFWHVSKKAADFLWKLNAELRKNDDKRFASTKLDEYPQPLTYKSDLDSFLKEKNLNEDFYDYFITSRSFKGVLERSSYYESYYKRFDKLINKATVKPPEELEKKLNEIVSKMQLFKPSFKMGNINFKKFNNEKTYYQLKDDFYFSSLLFDNQKEMENYIFGVILELYRIKIIDLLDKFQLVSKEKQ